MQLLLLVLRLEKHFDGDFTQDQEKEITFKRWPPGYQSWKLCLAPNGLIPVHMTALSGVGFNPLTATGYFDIPPPRWPTFLLTLFPILKEGMGLSLLDEFEVQYHVIKK